MLIIHAHLLVLVQRVDNQLHHTVDFSLKCMFFRFFSDFLDLSCIQPFQLDCLFLSKDRQVHTGESR